LYGLVAHDFSDRVGLLWEYPIGDSKYELIHLRAGKVTWHVIKFFGK